MFVSATLVKERLMLEVLENRRLMSVVVTPADANGLLVITGNHDAETVNVKQTAVGGDTVTLNVNGNDYSGVKSFSIAVVSGGDNIELDDLTIPGTVAGGPGD